MPNPRWERRSIPGHLFEIKDWDSGEPILRIRGGMMPTLAHAVLIESAPQLLAALEAFVFQVRQGAVLERDAIVTQAVEAIRKARGMDL